MLPLSEISQYHCINPTLYIPFDTSVNYCGLFNQSAIISNYYRLRLHKLSKIFTDWHQILMKAKQFESATQSEKLSFGLI